MNNPIKTIASKVVDATKEAIKSVKYLAGDNSQMPEKVKKYRESRGFRKY